MVEYQLGVIGAGNMAEALLRGVIASGFLPRETIVVSDPARQRREFFARELKVECLSDNAVPAGCRRVLLAVKPQVMTDVLKEIAPVVTQEALVISIAAGVKTALLDKALGGKGHLVRVMPNTAMLVSAGIAAVAAGPRATGDDLDWTGKLLEASGKTCVVPEEAMDAVTAVSGSGPAYFFYLIEAMIAAGIAEGLDPEIAALLAQQTCAGAARLLIETRQSPEALRARVTSPGGTTQRAIEVLQAAGVKEKLIEAIRAATERSRELGR